MHSWVRNITAKYFSYAAVSIDYSAKHISVLDCTSLEPKSVVTGGRRYSFNNNGQLNLFAGCFASEGRHDYVLGARVCGPNVFTRSSAELASNDIGPHHRWATGALFDMITTNHFINVQDRGWSGTGHGWAGANMVFWNCTASGSVTQSPWVSAKNYNISVSLDRSTREIGLQTVPMEFGKVIMSPVFSHSLFIRRNLKTACGILMISMFFLLLKW